MLVSGAYGYISDYLLLWAMLISLFVHTWFFFKLFPRSKYRKTGLVLGNLLVFFCMLGAVAMAVVTNIRFTAVATDSFGVSLPARRWFAIYTRVNSFGFRDDEWTREKPPGVHRIAFVGDSFTYGWGIKDEKDRFTELIQARFDKRDPGKVQVLNVAKPGWNTGDEAAALPDILDQLHIDEVVLCYVPNDIEGLIPTAKDFNPTRPPDSKFFNLDVSCLVDYLYRRIYLPRVPSVRGYDDWLARGYATDEIWRRHQQQLYHIAEICRERGVTLTVALFPFIKTSGQGLKCEALNQVLERFLGRIHIASIDLAPVIAGVPPSKLVVNAADAHPNERANRMFAGAIWSALYAGKSP